MIPQILLWRNRFRALAPRLAIPVILVLVALASFGLGRLSALGENPISIAQTEP